MPRATGLLLALLIVILFSTCTWIGNRYSIAPEPEQTPYIAPLPERLRDPQG